MIIRFVCYKLFPFALMVSVAMTVLLFRPPGWPWILFGNFILYAIYRYLSRIESYLSHDKRELELFTEENPGRLLVLKGVMAVLIFLVLYFLVQPRLAVKPQEDMAAAQARAWEKSLEEMRQQVAQAKEGEAFLQKEVKKVLFWLEDWKAQEEKKSAELKLRAYVPPTALEEPIKVPEVRRDRGEETATLPPEERQRQQMEKQYFLEEETKGEPQFEVKVIKKGGENKGSDQP